MVFGTDEPVPKDHIVFPDCVRGGGYNYLTRFESSEPGPQLLVKLASC